MKKSEYTDIIEQIKEKYCPPDYELSKIQRMTWEAFLKPLEYNTVLKGCVALFDGNITTYKQMPEPHLLQTFIIRVNKILYPYCPCCKDGFIDGHKIIKNGMEYESFTACDCKQGKTRQRAWDDDEGKHWPGMKSYSDANHQKCGNHFCRGLAKVKKDGGAYKREDCIGVKQ